MKDKFTGLGVAMVTPFLENKTVDYNALTRLTEHLINGEVDYLVVNGTTGESVTLSTSERRAVLDYVLEINNGRKPIVYGMGSNNTGHLIEDFKSFDLTGVDAILSVGPYYNKPTQTGLYHHYKALAEASPLPIILYNVPGRTGRNMQAETTLKLARDCKNIIGIKEASGSMSQIMTIIKNKPEDFMVISGDDAIALPIVTVGGDGCISVIGNAFPKEFGNSLRLGAKGQLKEAQELHYKLLEITKNLFVESNPSGIKELLQFLQVCDNHVRLPLVPISPELKENLYQALVDSELMISA
jgi:4-hydroxy-tetrahydrodipicolinate synthase